MRTRIGSGPLGLSVLGAWLLAGGAQAAWPPDAAMGLAYTNAFFPSADYDPSVPTQESIIGFATGDRAATAGEITRCLEAWAAASPRVRLFEYARSHEGRPLFCVVVTAPSNLERLDQIRSGLDRLADPRGLPEAEGEALVQSSPVVGWLAYTIHGDETEGSDAALAVLYHLVADRSAAVTDLLERVVVVVDPVMNPDGRERFLKMIAENRGTRPNLDDRSLLHQGYLPYGRGNHYLFDLNRDWLWAVHPETRGRIREVARWHPLLYVDAHGMGAQETHLFSPPRPPINPHFPAYRDGWQQLFAQDQARALDRYGWLYYTGEWHEEWYPGYSDAYVSYRGAIGILYEQARVAEHGVRRPGGRILSYRESVHHHVAGSMANLETLHRQASGLLRDFWESRRAALDPAGSYGQRTFAVLPTANRTRLRGFVDLMRVHGVEVFRAREDFRVPLATDLLGRRLEGCTLPAGTVLVPNRQPLAHWVAAALEFDPRMPEAVLREEREELLRHGRSRIYDTTAWNVPMFYGLEAWTLPTDLPAAAEPYPDGVEGPVPPVAEVAEPVAYVIDGADDGSVTAAARLLERGVEVRVADRVFQLEGRDFGRGSVVVTRIDNRHWGNQFADGVMAVARELALAPVAVATGLGPGELPDLGGRHFRRLERPRVALVGREGYSTVDFGAIWHALDHRLGIEHSTVSGDRLQELSRYNVVILPDRGSSPFPAPTVSALREWARAGGTLIAVGGSARALARENTGLGESRLLPDVLDKLAEYELAVLREWLGRRIDLAPGAELWSHTVSAPIRYPWQAAGGGHPDEKEMRRRDGWNRLFMPQGALLAGRIDDRHWLTVGCAEPLPLLLGAGEVLMGAGSVEVPVRIGYLTAASAGNPATEPASPGGPKTEGDKKEPPRVGWCALPEGSELYLRMSGLLWPEAAQRLANGAYVTRESIGRGQVILFAGAPAFRGSSLGTLRLFLNAVVYGPGCGTAPVIKP